MISLTKQESWKKPLSLRSMSLSIDAGINCKRDSAIIKWIILQDMQPNNHNNLKTTSAEDCQGSIHPQGPRTLWHCDCGAKHLPLTITQHWLVIGQKAPAQKSAAASQRQLCGRSGDCFLMSAAHSADLISIKRKKSMQTRPLPPAKAVTNNWGGRGRWCRFDQLHSERIIASKLLARVYLKHWRFLQVKPSTDNYVALQKSS